MSKPITDVGVALGLLLLLGAKWDPFHWFMPDALQMIVLCVLVALFGLFAGMIYREKPADEREAFHLYKASRGGYIAGILTICSLIVYQDLQHRLDPSLLLILSVMVLVKLGIQIWSRYRD